MELIRQAWWKPRNITKTVLVMKLTVILLTVAFLNVSASGVSQYITYSGQNVSLKTVLTVVERQTGFVAFYPEAELKAAKPITIDAENMSLEDFLSQIFKSQSLEFKISGKSIFIYAKASTAVTPDRQLVNILKDTIIDVTGRVERYGAGKRHQ